MNDHPLPVLIAIVLVASAGLARFPGARASAESDLRGMVEVQAVRAGLPEVLSLRPVQFKVRGRAGRHYGLVAQEVGALLPDVVSGEGEMLSVRYDELVPVLIRAIQEQQTLIEMQSRRIRRLERQLERTEAAP